MFFYSIFVILVQILIGIFYSGRPATQIHENDVPAAVFKLEFMLIYVNLCYPVIILILYLCSLCDIKKTLTVVVSFQLKT